MTRKILLFILPLLFTLVTKAQFYKSILPTPEFSNVLEKIVRDFKYNFKNIAGEQLEKQGEVDTYESAVKLPGATACVINKYHSVKDTTASWQCVLYQGEDYKEALKAYRTNFKMLNKSIIHLVDRSLVSFAGDLQEPTEDLRFTVSTLKLNMNDHRYDRFEAAVELLSSYTGWQVNLNFYNKKPDQEID
jgi:hypothetical protein